MNNQAFLKIEAFLTEDDSPFACDRIKAFFLGSTMFKKVVTDKLINTIITLTSQVNDCI